MLGRCITSAREDIPLYQHFGYGGFMFGDAGYAYFMIAKEKLKIVIYHKFTIMQPLLN